MVTDRDIERLVAENFENNPEFDELYVWAHPDEFRFIYVDPTSPKTFGDKVRLTRFSGDANMPYPLVVGLVRPEEARHLNLPADWGTWESATHFDLRPRQ